MEITTLLQMGYKLICGQYYEENLFYAWVSPNGHQWSIPTPAQWNDPEWRLTKEHWPFAVGASLADAQDNLRWHIRRMPENKILNYLNGKDK